MLWYARPRKVRSMERPKEKRRQEKTRREECGAKEKKEKK